MGHVIGAESAGGKSFLEGRGDLLGAISAEQIEEFLKLAEERTVGVGQPAQISFDRFRRADSVEQLQQSFLRLGAPGSRAVFE